MELDDDVLFQLCINSDIDTLRNLRQVNKRLYDVCGGEKILEFKTMALAFALLSFSRISFTLLGLPYMFHTNITRNADMSLKQGIIKYVLPESRREDDFIKMQGILRLYKFRNSQFALDKGKKIELYATYDEDMNMVNDIYSLLLKYPLRLLSEEDYATLSGYVTYTEGKLWKYYF